MYTRCGGHRFRKLLLATIQLKSWIYLHSIGIYVQQVLELTIGQTLWGHKSYPKLTSESVTLKLIQTNLFS